MKSKTIDYFPELWDDIIDNFTDYSMVGWTVCGAQDPAFIVLGQGFYGKHPSLKEYEYVRVINKYLNEWNSDTLLEFSNKEMTDEEYVDYEKVMEEEDASYVGCG